MRSFGRFVSATFRLCRGGCLRERRPLGRSSSAGSRVGDRSRLECCSGFDRPHSAPWTASPVVDRDSRWSLGPGASAANLSPLPDGPKCVRCCVTSASEVPPSVMRVPFCVRSCSERRVTENWPGIKCGCHWLVVAVARKIGTVVKRTGLFSSFLSHCFRVCIDLAKETTHSSSVRLFGALPTLDVPLSV